MPTVDIKGINTTRCKLADGTVKVYRYLGKGGPRIDGEPGTEEFFASYLKALKSKKAEPDARTFASLVDRYRASADFKKLAPRTRDGYETRLEDIGAKFATMPMSVFDNPKARRRFRVMALDWRDDIGLQSTHRADATFTVLARVCSWAEDRGLIEDNPLRNPKKLHRATRRDMVWTEEQEAAFRRSAPPHVLLAFDLALWTGQRQGDLLSLTWRAFDGDTLSLTQGKTRQSVIVPVAAPLRALLDHAKANRPDAVTILTTMQGRPWTESGFRATWRKAVLAAGVEGVTFHDLRGTFVTRASIAGASEAEITTITGHMGGGRRSTASTTYLKPDLELAQACITKLERSRFAQTLSQMGGV